MLMLRTLLFCSFFSTLFFVSFCSSTPCVLAQEDVLMGAAVAAPQSPANITGELIKIKNVTENIGYQANELSVKTGQLIQMDAAAFGDGSFSWMLANSDEKFSTFYDSRVAIFSTGSKTAKYIFVLAFSPVDGKVKQFKVVINVGKQSTDGDCPCDGTDDPNNNVVDQCKDLSGVAKQTCVLGFKVGISQQEVNSIKDHIGTVSLEWTTSPEGTDLSVSLFDSSAGVNKQWLNGMKAVSYTHLTLPTKA